MTTNKEKELLTKVVNLYFKHSDDFAIINDEDIKNIELWDDVMLPLMEEACGLIGHEPMVSDQCMMPEHDYCPRCGTRREELD